MGIAMSPDLIGRAVILLSLPTATGPVSTTQAVVDLQKRAHMCPTGRSPFRDAVLCNAVLPPHNTTPPPLLSQPRKGDRPLRIETGWEQPLPTAEHAAAVAPAAASTTTRLAPPRGRGGDATTACPATATVRMDGMYSMYLYRKDSGPSLALIWTCHVLGTRGNSGAALGLHIGAPGMFG